MVCMCVSMACMCVSMVCMCVSNMLGQWVLYVSGCVL